MTHPRAMLRAATGERGVSGWQPIATAPTDQTEVLLFIDRPARAIVVGWSRGKSWTTCWNDDPLPKPTHWMPLPDAPTPESEV